MAKKIPLHSIHEQLGAKMVAFAGYYMPVRYTYDIAEHQAVRTNVGVFDVSHMGEFLITGPQAFKLVQKVTSNDLSVLQNGKAQYGYLPNEQNGIVDDLITYRIKKDEYLLVVNASNIEKDWQWISSWNEPIGANMQNISEETCLFAVQGPKATEVLQQIVSADLTALPFYTFIKTNLGTIQDIIVSATGYTGAGGFEVYVPKNQATVVWKKIFAAGKKYGIVPVGLAARDTLRLEMGYCLYGNDIDETTSPLEAGLAWVTKFSNNFVNADALQAQKAAGLNQKLTGFEMLEKGIPRRDYPIFSTQGQAIGRVTSGTISPTLKKGIGLAYLKKGYFKQGTEVLIGIRNRRLKARVKRPPFV